MAFSLHWSSEQHPSAAHIQCAALRALLPSGNRNSGLFLPWCIWHTVGDVSSAGQWKHSCSMSHWLLRVKDKSWLVIVWHGGGVVVLCEICIFVYLTWSLKNMLPIFSTTLSPDDNEMILPNLRRYISTSFSLKRRS